MSEATQFYVITIIVFLAVDLMACWSLNLQFGVVGVLNFAFIVFQAIGAYTAALLTLGPASNNGGVQRYIFGLELPFPLPVIAAGIAGAAGAYVIGAVVLRRLKRDYQAIALLVVSLIATDVAKNQVGLVNGSSGLALLPKPLESTLGLSRLNYQWVYAAYSLVVACLVFFVVHRLTSSPHGRILRAVRDNERVAQTAGHNPYSLQLSTMVIGGAIAGISGAILVQFLGAWGPRNWLFPVTFLYLTAILIGGTGNNRGALLGALLIPVLLPELARFLPQFGYAGTSEASGWVLIGLLMLVFIWFRPQGLIPERPEAVRNSTGA